MENKSDMQPSVCFHVQKIVGVSTGKGNLKNYQVQWAPSWVSGFHLVGCENLIEQFLRQQTDNEDCIGEVSGSDFNCSRDEDDLNSEEGHQTSDVKGDEVGFGEPQDEPGCLFDDEVGSDDAGEHLNIPDISPKHRLAEEIHRQSVNVNDSGFYINEGNNACLYSKDTSVNRDESVEVVVSLESPTSYREKDNDQCGGKNTNPNFEWLERNVPDIYDGSSKDDDPRPLTFQYDTLFDSSGEKVDDRSGDINSAETFADAQITDHAKEEPLAHFSKEFMNGENIPPDFVEVKTEVIELPVEKVETDASADYEKRFKTEVISKTYECNTCHKIFKNNGSLRRHSKIHIAGGNAFRCGICYRRFESQTNLEKHELIHSGERRYVCNVCNKKFSENGNLQAHIRTHTGERPYKCTFCSKMFLTSSDLKRHVRVHTGERPYECKVCLKRFKINDHLQKHSRTHVDERPSMCDNI